MAEDDESHRKTARNVSAASGGILMGAGALLLGWGITDHGRWAGPAVVWLACGLLVGALALAAVWYLMHQRRPLLALGLAAPPTPEARVLSSSEQRSDLTRRIAALEEYRSKVQRSGLLTKALPTAWRPEFGLSGKQVSAELAELADYLNRKLHPIADIVDETGVSVRFTHTRKSDYPILLTQAIGVLEHRRESLPVE